MSMWKMLMQLRLKFSYALIDKIREQYMLWQNTKNTLSVRHNKPELVACKESSKTVLFTDVAGEQSENTWLKGTPG